MTALGAENGSLLPPIQEEDVLALAVSWYQAGHRVALGTVLNTFGSAPRGVGSHILVRDDGAFAGSVSAGCVENLIITQSQAAMRDGNMRKIAIDSAPEPNGNPGLSCGGKIDILIEPVTAEKAASFHEILRGRASGRVVVRALQVETGRDILIDACEEGAAFASYAAAVVAEEKNRVVSVAGEGWLLVAYNVARELVIIGAVHIGEALAYLGAGAGFRVRVIDPRAAYTSGGRFSDVPVEHLWPDEAFAQKPLHPASAVAVLSHDPKIDDDALLAALASPSFYIGALGSKRSHQNRLSRLREAGVKEEDLARIHGPIGLGIGAKSPAEIAISILAEIIQARRQ